MLSGTDGRMDGWIQAHCLLIMYYCYTYPGRFEEQLQERHDAEIRRLQAEEDKVMGIDRETTQTRLKEKQVWRVCVCVCGGGRAGPFALTYHASTT